MLENWFYDSYMFLNTRNCEFINFGKTSENDVFTYNDTATKKLLGITINDHLNFNKHISNVCKSARRKVNALMIVSSLLS